MGGTQSIPVVGEVVTIADSAGRAIAGTVALPFDKEASKKLYDSAGQTWVNYADRSAIVSNVRVAAAAIEGDTKERDRLLKAQGDAWTEVGENTPVIGHIKGVVHLAQGDTEAAERCLTNATRTAVVIGATVATGGGALVGGAVAVGASAAYDGIATGVSSAAHGEYHPSGYVAGVTQAVKTGDATDIYSAASAPIGDFAAGAMAGRAKTSAARLAKEGPVGVGIIVDSARQSAVEVAVDVGRAEPHAIVQGTHTQLSLTELRNVVKLTHPQDLLDHIENDAKSDRMRSAQLERHMDPTEERDNYITYTFVRVRRVVEDRVTDSGFRTISTVDARAQLAERPAGAREYIGHSSLVGEGEECIAAGEIHMTRKGVLLEINEESGHYQFDLETLRRQTGRAWPIHKFLGRRLPAERLAEDLQMLNRLFEEENPGLTQELIQKARIIQRNSTVFAILTNFANASNLSDLVYHAHVKRTGKEPVLTFAFADLVEARTAYNAIDSTKYAKVISHSGSNEILDRNSHAETGALVARIPKLNPFNNKGDSEPRGNALCFPQFFSVPSTGVDKLAQALTPAATLPQGGQLYVGRYQAGNDWLPCGIGGSNGREALGIWRPTGEVANIEALVNMSEMEWVANRSYNRTERVMVPVGWSSSKKCHTYAVRGRSGARTLVGMAETDLQDRISIRGLQHAGAADDEILETSDFDYLCWKVLE